MYRFWVLFPVSVFCLPQVVGLSDLLSAFVRAIYFEPHHYLWVRF